MSVVDHGLEPVLDCKMPKKKILGSIWDIVTEKFRIYYEKIYFYSLGCIVGLESFSTTYELWTGQLRLNCRLEAGKGSSSPECSVHMWSTHKFVCAGYRIL
jgi:hypothetical protein